jgi:hypothetical protein
MDPKTIRKELTDPPESPEGPFERSYKIALDLFEIGHVREAGDAAQLAIEGAIQEENDILLVRIVSLFVILARSAREAEQRALLWDDPELRRKATELKDKVEGLQASIASNGDMTLTNLSHLLPRDWDTWLESRADLTPRDSAIHDKPGSERHQ